MAKKKSEFNKNNIGVWDAIILADEQRFKIEQREKKQMVRNKHIEL